MDKAQVFYKINTLREDGLLENILNEIITNIALEIVETPTHEMDKRQELYMLTKAVKRLDEKLQEYQNNYNFQENE